MCGIFAHIIHGVEKERSELIRILLNGLHRLEYRGYDSAGLACDGKSCIDPVVIREVGTIDRLEERVAEVEFECPSLMEDKVLQEHIGIAHTRWATHGPPSRENSHPQSSDKGNHFLVVHNGIITNNHILRDMLSSHGISFVSQTDTETVAKLAKFLYDQLLVDNPSLTFHRLVMAVMHQIEGAYAMVFRSKYYPNELVACRLGSPLVVGTKPVNGRSKSQLSVTLVPQAPLRMRRGSFEIGDVTPDNEFVKFPKPRQETLGELFFSSDASAIVEHTDRVFYLEDNDVVHVTNGRLNIYNFHTDGNSEKLAQDRVMSTLPMEIESIMKGNFPHYMLKEIYEQPEALTSTMRGRIKMSPGGSAVEINLGGVKERLRDIMSCNRMIFIACGSSYNACLAARQAVEELTELPVSVELASDFNDRMCPLFRSDVCVFVSQSGETRDTLESLRYAKSRDTVTIGIVNVVGSEISRMTDCGMHLNAGCEIGVASTKAYTCQIVAMVMMALQLSRDSRDKERRRTEIFKALTELPSMIEKTVKIIDEKTKALAKRLEHEKSILLFGRGYQYATCLEGALKIKELSYIHTEGIHAGELKHGPLALIDDDMPVILFSSMDNTRVQVHNALQQVLARTTAGSFVLVCSEDDYEIKGMSNERCQILEVPSTVDCLQSILSVLPMQLLSYHLAVSRGLNVDQPRNLAKSVTV